MHQNLFTLKNDKYRKHRGGYSRFLNIFCASCNTHVLLYQKDGPGPLKRMYLDRIVAPEITKRKKDFTCPKCKKILGTFFTYEKERRAAIRLYQDSVVKKVGKGVFQMK